jgi:hypothetical protein
MVGAGPCEYIGLRGTAEIVRIAADGPVVMIGRDRICTVEEYTVSVGSECPGCTHMAAAAAYGHIIAERVRTVGTWYIGVLAYPIGTRLCISMPWRLSGTGVAPVTKVPEPAYSSILTGAIEMHRVIYII